MWLVGFVQMYVKSALVTLGCAVLLHVPDHKSCVELILFFFWHKFMILVRSLRSPWDFSQAEQTHVTQSFLI